MTAVLVHLLRHGVTAAEGRLIGHTDVPPSPEGVEACLSRAMRLKVDSVHCSTLARARAPALALAAVFRRPLHEDARWRELDFGAWDGMAIDAVDSDALARFRADPAGAPPPGGESWATLVARVGAALVMLEGTALVVTHGGAMRAALAAACRIDFPALWAFHLPHAALLTLRLWPAYPGGGEIVGLAT